VLTPDTPERLYSTRLRTAVVFTGSGTAGAYHAGVLRALQEAGVRIDLVGGRGAGAASAVFTAIDGAARLWEPDGVWKGPSPRAFYAWRPPLRAAGWALTAAAGIIAVPLALLVLAVVLAIAGMLLTLVGLARAAAAVTSWYSSWIEVLFTPASLPTIIPRLALLAILIGVCIVVVSTAMAWLRTGPRRRSRVWGVARLLGAPLTAATLSARCTTELWNLIRGAAPLATPEPAELGRRYLELLTENLGQPGFRELLLTVHDMDVRRDLVFALLGAKPRARFFNRPHAADNGARQLEAFDLAGAARDHLLDALLGALAVPIATDPHLIAFAAESTWRGETHRVCDRPGALSRLVEEIAAAGAEQVVLVSASPMPARAHELSAGRSDLRGRAGEQLAAFEAADVRDVIEQFTGRFAGLFVIRPAYNPVGPLDFTGVYDERSDRTHTLGELLDRGYEDAYRQFIEPVVGASGDKIATVQQ
jgi:hypothetical protein